MRDEWSLLGEEFTKRLEDSAKTETLPRGTRIYTQGEEPPQWLYRIEKGEVELRLSLDGEDEVIGYRRKGEWVGWFSVLPEKPNPISAVVAIDAEVRAFPQEIMKEAFEQSAPFAGAVARAIDEIIFMIHKYLQAEHRAQAIDKVETFPFRKRVSEIMKTPVHTCECTLSAVDAAKMMNDKHITSLIILDGLEKVIGIITEKDIVRSIVSKGMERDTLACEVGSRKVKYISPQKYVYQAMALMKNTNIRHLPVVEDGKAVGMVTMRDLMILRSSETLNLISQIEDEADPSRLVIIRHRAIPVFRTMLEESVPPLQISRVITHINHEVHRRAIRLTLEEMGSPPVDFCFFVTGSHGRHENHLDTDQDHGMILETYPPERHNEVNDYFIPFTERLCEMLDQAGMVYCKGNVMCLNPVWRKTLPEWKAQLKIWLRGSDNTSVRYLTLLADIAPVYGNEGLLMDLRHWFFQSMKKRGDALQGLYEEAAEHKAPLGILGGIITEKDKEKKGQIDLKKSGIIFMVEALRILAIKYGIQVPGTIERLKALGEIDVITYADEEFLSSCYSSLYYFLLRTQLRKVAKGIEPDTYMKVYMLSERDREMLTKALQSVKRMQSLLRSDFGHVVL